MEKNDFYDKVHTTPQGSKRIANLIYPYLKEIIKKNNLYILDQIVRIIPKTVTADTAATPKAKFLFFSIFFSFFNLEGKSVTFIYFKEN